MQIIHFKKFCVPWPVSTGTPKVDKLLKMPPNSISEGSYNFSKFPGGHAPRPPSAGMLCMPVPFPPFKSLDPPLNAVL